MKIELNKSVSLWLLQGVERGTISLSEIKPQQDALFYAECIKDVGWSVKPLQIDDPYISNILSGVTGETITLSQAEKSAIIVGIVRGWMEDTDLPRLLPIDNRSVIGGIVYIGYSSNDDLPDVPDNIKRDYSPIMRGVGCWGYCASFLADKMTAEADIIDELATGVLFFCK